MIYHNKSSSSRPLKILTVGNSFAQDATDLLPALARGAGKEIIVGRVTLGGCALSRHAKNIEIDKAAAVWCESLFPGSLAVATYAPRGLDADAAADLRRIASEAVARERQESAMAKTAE